MNSKQKRTNHIQVLVEDDLQTQLYRLINLKALNEGTPPLSVSSYVRDLILKEVHANDIDLKMWNKSTIKKINNI